MKSICIHITGLPDDTNLLDLREDLMPFVADRGSQKGESVTCSMPGAGLGRVVIGKTSTSFVDCLFVKCTPAVKAIGLP